MSYDVYLTCAGPVDKFKEGGIYELFGSTEAHLNVTWNYSKIYLEFEFSLRDLHGQKASETIEKLQEIVSSLGTDKDQDYWAATPGNAGHTLSILLKWARQYPECIWEVV